MAVDWGDAKDVFMRAERHLAQHERAAAVALLESLANDPATFDDDRRAAWLLLAQCAEPSTAYQYAQLAASATPDDSAAQHWLQQTASACGAADVAERAGERAAELRKRALTELIRGGWRVPSLRNPA